MYVKPGQGHVDGRRLVGSGEKIKGQHPCVCFTEAPLTSLQSGLVNPSAYSRYSPFGIMFAKRWLFNSGGRPVIYQTDGEYSQLPDAMKWRHMRYEPGSIDFTWEREWRVQRDAIDFSPCNAAIVVPSTQWARQLVGEHDAEQDYEVRAYSLIMDELLASQYKESYPWQIVVLEGDT